MVLNLHPELLKSAGDIVGVASKLLTTIPPGPVPACGGDAVSKALMSNLNARGSWLIAHLRHGAGQADHASQGIGETADAYTAQDAAAASTYTGGGYNAAGPPATATAWSPKAPAAPASPNTQPVPDITGVDGETLATQLLAGSGPGPSLAAAAYWEGVNTQVLAANQALTDSYTLLVASGESAAHPGIAAKLTNSMAWTEAVAGHSQQLAAGYGDAAALHGAMSTAVGTPVSWRTLKESLTDARIQNAMNGGRSQPLVDSLSNVLDDREAGKTLAAGDYQVAGTGLSDTPVDGLLDPALDPNSTEDPDKDKKDEKDHEDSADDSSQDNPLSSLAQLPAQLLGQVASPLQALGKTAQQLGQQAGKMAGSMAPHPQSHPIKAHPIKATHHGGGGHPIKPAASAGRGLHPASLTGSPAATPATSHPIKPVAAAPAKGGGGLGMMPLGQRPNSEQSARVESYEQPLSEVEEAGRAGVVGSAAKPAAPKVAPEAKNAVKDRLARRQKAAEIEAGS